MAKYYSTLYKLSDSDDRKHIAIHDIKEDSKIYNDFKLRLKQFCFEKYDWSHILNDNIKYVNDDILYIDGDEDNMDSSNMVFGFYLIDKRNKLYECYRFFKDIYETFETFEEFEKSKIYLEFESNYKEILLECGWIENYENNNVCKYDDNKKLIGYKTNYTFSNIKKFVKNQLYIFIKDSDVPRITNTENCLTGDEICFIKNHLKFPEAMDFIVLNEDNGIIYKKSEFIEFLERFAFDINDFSEMIENFVDFETIYTVC